MKPKTILALLAIFSWLPLRSPAQTFDAQIIGVAQTATTLDVNVQIRSKGSTFGMGSANLVIDYTGNITNPVLLTATNFAGSSTGSIPYGTMTVTTPASPVGFSLNIVYNGGSSTTVAPSFMDVAVVRFTITGGGTAALTWRTAAPNRTVVFNDVAQEIGADVLTGFTSGPLPVQLQSFIAIVENKSTVRLAWSTLTEVNNYGFEVQRSASAAQDFVTLPGSFVKGYGTSLTSHSYTFSDLSGSDRWYYRLKQLDLDGAVHYSDAVLASTVSSVTQSRLPTEFSLEQNYPNPFNPSTMIQYAVPRNTRVTVEVFNILGQQIATLVDEIKEAGFYNVPFNAEHVASGIYFYRLNTQEQSFLRKMVVMK